MLMFSGEATLLGETFTEPRVRVYAIAKRNHTDLALRFLNSRRIMLPSPAKLVAEKL